MEPHHAAQDSREKQNPSAPSRLLLFRDFMQDALYHPERGYYTRQAREPGRRGDFSTAASLLPDVARSIAAWASRHAPKQWWKPWHLIECGAGSGEMAHTIARLLPLPLRLRLRYHIVEVSNPFREAQRRRLAHLRVTWHDDMPAALAACDGSALILCHELVDAFPCDLLEFTSGQWHAIALRRGEAAIEEELVPLAQTPLPHPDAPSLREPSLQREGQRIEVFQSWDRWLASWKKQWHTGAMLTVDYGGTAQEIYAQKPRGTLRAYWHHQLFEGAEIYHRRGLQDITADVCTDDLIEWSASHGLQSDPLQNLGVFCDRHLGHPADLPPAVRESFFALVHKPQKV